MKGFVSELWKWFKEQPRAVKVRFVLGVIPSLFLLGVGIVGAIAESVNDYLICWIRGDKLPKNLWGQKPYCPKEV